MQIENYISMIENTLNYIEENIKDNISLEEIAIHTHLSKYHIHRIFKSVTNKSLIGYIRSRKLTHSTKALLQTDSNILHIAYEYGFEHEQSYIRSFKSQFNITPGQFRKKQVHLPIECKIDMHHIHPLSQGVIFQPKFFLKPKFYVVGKEYKITIEEDYNHLAANKVGFDFFSNDRMSISNIKFPDIYLGFVDHLPNEPNINSYIPCVEVNDLSSIPVGMIGKTIPTYKYAVFKYIGIHGPEQISIRTLREIIDYVLYKWLINTDYKQADTFHIERIESHVCQEDYCEVEIYVPILE